MRSLRTSWYNSGHWNGLTIPIMTGVSRLSVNLLVLRRNKGSIYNRLSELHLCIAVVSNTIVVDVVVVDRCRVDHVGARNDSLDITTRFDQRCSTDVTAIAILVERVSPVDAHVKACAS